MLPIRKFENDLCRVIRRLDKAIKYAEGQQQEGLSTVATEEEITQLKECVERLKKIYWEAKYIDSFYV